MEGGIALRSYDELVEFGRVPANVIPPQIDNWTEAELSVMFVENAALIVVAGDTVLKATKIRAPALLVLNCQGVARSVVDSAADRLQCPQLHRLVSDTYTDAGGFEEVD